MAYSDEKKISESETTYFSAVYTMTIFLVEFVERFAWLGKFATKNFRLKKGKKWYTNFPIFFLLKKVLFKAI